MITEQAEALRYVSENKSGNLNSLQDVIDNNLIKQFELVGFISQGIDNQGKNTWTISELGKSTLKIFYEKPNFLERIQGWYCHVFLNL